MNPNTKASFAATKMREWAKQLQKMDTDEKEILDEIARITMYLEQTAALLEALQGQAIRVSSMSRQLLQQTAVHINGQFALDCISAIIGVEEANRAIEQGKD